MSVEANRNAKGGLCSVTFRDKDKELTLGPGNAHIHMPGESERIGGIAVESEPAIESHEVATSPTIGALALALSKTQGAMKHASMDRENPFYKMRYATLASVWDAIRGPLSANELAVSQDPVADNGRVGVITWLLHSSGEWKRSRLLLRPVKDDPQGMGSALTYARRYALAAIVGAVADEDDDAKAASRTAAPKPAKPEPKPAPKPANAPQTQPAGQGVAARDAQAEEAYHADLAELKRLKGEAGLTDQQLVNRIRLEFSNKSFAQLTPEERVRLKELLEGIIAAHKAAE